MLVPQLSGMCTMQSTAFAGVVKYTEDHAIVCTHTSFTCVLLSEFPAWQANHSGLVCVSELSFGLATPMVFENVIDPEFLIDQAWRNDVLAYWHRRVFGTGLLTAHERADALRKFGARNQAYMYAKQRVRAKPALKKRSLPNVPPGAAAVPQAHHNQACARLARTSIGSCRAHSTRDRSATS